MTMTGNGDDVPAKLYKYGVAERVDILIGGKIRFTQPEYLNDPLDIQPEIEQISSDSDIAKQLKRFQSRQNVRILADRFTEAELKIRTDALARQGQKLKRPELRKLRHAIFRDVLRSPEFHQARLEVAALMPAKIRRANQELAKSFPKNLNRTVGVLSLTESADNFLMWSHYAYGHAGFVIEFDSHSALFDGQSRYGISSLNKVVYKENVPFPYLIDGELTSEEVLKELFYVKDTIWDYEKEWRMIGQLATADETIVLANSTKICLYKFNPNAVTGVIFGARMSTGDRTKVLKALEEDGYKHVKVSQARLESGKVKIAPYQNV